MKKGPSKINGPSKQDFSLPRAKILRGRKNFQRLFERDAIIFREKFVNLRFLLISESNTDSECLMGFIVKKGLGKAVKRNRTKRLLREAYRLNQQLLTGITKIHSLNVHGVLMANTADMNFDQAEADVVALLNKARNYILSIIDS